MENKNQKHNLPVITAEVYNFTPSRYELRKGTLPDAPPCPFGNRFKWIGFDKKEKKYVWVTKSVFKKLIATKDETEVAQHEKYLEETKVDE